MPTSVLRTVTVDGVLIAPDQHRMRPNPPGRGTNEASGRVREYLTPAEVETLIKAARRRGRYGVRDALAIMLAYRHGLRAVELVELEWAQVDFTTARLTVKRVKGSISGIAHPIQGDEMRALRAIQREQSSGTRHVFMGERGQVSVAWFQRMLKRTGAKCGLPLVHPHMLRHACGFTLADKGRDLREIQDYLGHKSINNTVIYTRLRPSRFDHIWA